MGKYNVKLMYRPQEKKHHIELIKDNFFGNDKGYGYFGKDKKQYDFVLEDGINNLYEPIRNEVLNTSKKTILNGGETIPIILQGIQCLPK